MSNMSYCRFENTSNDLRDCASALEELLYEGEGKLSRSELRAAIDLAETCAQILSLIGGNHPDCDENDLEQIERIAGDCIRAANDNATN